MIYVLKRLACRAFAVRAQDRNCVTNDVAEFLGVIFKNERPSDDYVKAFRARHPSITVRLLKILESAKLDAQHLEYVINCKRDKTAVS